MRTTLWSWLGVAVLGVLCPQSRAGEIELGAQGYAFTLRDTGDSVLRTIDPNSERPSFSSSSPLRLEGLGWRARAGVAFHGGAERVVLAVQRVRDGARESLVSRFGPFALEQHEEVEAALTTVDARYERRVTSSGPFELRVQGGYRFARLRQSRVLSGSCPVCRELLDARFARVTSASRLTGHGLRAGLATGARLMGPLRFESEGGLSLLAATQDDTFSFSSAAGDEPRRRRSLATWELSAGLRAEWRRVSIAAGYRFERWSRVPPLLLLDSELGFDGFTFGLGWRFGI